jgi:hypothetical protein
MVAARVANAFLQQSTGGNAGNRAPSVKTEFKLVEIFSGADSSNEQKFREVLSYMEKTFVDNAAYGCKESLFSESENAAFIKAHQYKEVFDKCITLLGTNLADLVLNTAVQFKLPEDGHLNFVKRIKKLLTQVNKGLKKPKKDRSGVLPPLAPAVLPAAPSSPPAAPFNGGDAMEKLMRFMECSEERARQAEERTQQLEQQLATALQKLPRVRSPRPVSSSSSSAAPRSRTFVSNAASVLQEARLEVAHGFPHSRSASTGRSQAWAPRPETLTSWEDSN